MTEHLTGSFGRVGMRYRRRCVDVDAIQWTGRNLEDVLMWMDWPDYRIIEGRLFLFEPGKPTAINPTNYLLKDQAGDYFRLSEPAFHERYEEVPT